MIVHPYSFGYGNEFHQLQRYMSITDTNLHVNSTLLFEKYNACENETICEKGFRSYTCKTEIRDEQKVSGLNLWNRKFDLLDSIRFQRNCNYLATNFQFYSFVTPGHSCNQAFENIFEFAILQSDCKIPFPYSKGGSTIEVFASSPLILTPCRVIDQFDDSYIVQCRLPYDYFSVLHDSSLKTSSYHRLCLNVSAYVHFEHFDAFWDVGNASWASLEYLAYQGTACGDVSVSPEGLAKPDNPTLSSIPDTINPPLSSIHSQSPSSPLTSSLSSNLLAPLSSSISSSSPLWWPSPSSPSSPISKLLSGLFSSYSDSPPPMSYFLQCSSPHYPYKGFWTRSPDIPYLRLPLSHHTHSHMKTQSLSNQTPADLSSSLKTLSLPNFIRSRPPGFPPPFYPNDDDFEWGGTGSPRYLTLSGFQQCQARTRIMFVGESHMRYQFDVVMDRYVDRLRVGRYHGNMNVSGIAFRDMTFSARMARFIDQIPPCGNGRSPQEGTTYVLQTGSWDLQFFPPRGLVFSPHQGRAVVEAIRKLLLRTEQAVQRGECSSNLNPPIPTSTSSPPFQPRPSFPIRLVFLTAMPHPWCSSKDAHCQRLANYWRNNANVRASSQALIEALLALHSPHISLIDPSAVLLPRFPAAFPPSFFPPHPHPDLFPPSSPFHAATSPSFPHVFTPTLPPPEFPCVDHFLCNNPPRGLTSVPGGLELANEVLNVACDVEVFSHSFSSVTPSKPLLFSDGHRYILPAADTKVFVELEKELIAFRARLREDSDENADAMMLGQVNKAQPMGVDRYFIVNQGCRREIPNLETLQALSLPLHTFIPASPEQILDLPPCPRELLPSRKTGTLVQTYSTRQVSFMDRGYRRKVDGVGTIVAFGLDFDNVSWVLEEDFTAIPPHSEIIHGPQDCWSCSK